MINPSLVPASILLVVHVIIRPHAFCPLLSRWLETTVQRIDVNGSMSFFFSIHFRFKFGFGLHLRCPPLLRLSVAQKNFMADARTANVGATTHDQDVVVLAVVPTVKPKKELTDEQRAIETAKRHNRRNKLKSKEALKPPS